MSEILNHATRFDVQSEEKRIEKKRKFQFSVSIVSVVCEMYAKFPKWKQNGFILNNRLQSCAKLYLLLTHEYLSD